MPTLRHRLITSPGTRRRAVRPPRHDPHDPVTVEITDALDRLAHHVAQAEYAAGLARGHGSYRAICGTTVLPASLFTIPGRPCPACTGVQQVDEQVHRATGSHRPPRSAAGQRTAG